VEKAAMRVRCTFLAALLAALTTSAYAQEARKYTIAVAVDSTDPRVQAWGPELRAQAAGVVEKTAHNVHAIVVTGSTSEAREQARNNSADYLLRLELSPHSSASVGFGGPGIQDPDIIGRPRARIQGAIFLAWTIESVTGPKLKLHDSRIVKPYEYPLGPSSDWLRDIASRSIRDGATAAMGKLKSKKAIQP
jgi:hypothetical protein